MSEISVKISRYLKQCLLLRQSAQYEEAGRLCEEALMQWPNHAALWLQRCEIYEAQQQWPAALFGRQHLSKITPSDYANLSEIADLHQRMGDFEQSVLAYKKAQSLVPDHPVIANNLGNALQLVHRYEEALYQYQRAIKGDANYFDAWHNCAVTLRRLERMSDAQRACERSLALSPDHPKTLWNLALLKLLLGDYAAGWPLYESRWKNPELGLHHLEFTEPSLLGRPDVSGKHVFIWAEQGLGDVLQMMRYVFVLLERGARVSVQVPKALHRIAQTLAAGVDVYVTGQRPVAFDFQCPYMSLPLVCETTLSSIPCAMPYINVSKQSQDSWMPQRVGHQIDAEVLQVGLVWSGRAAHRNDHNRSLQLEQLRPIFEMVNIQYWSLQKEYRPSDKKLVVQLGDRLIDCSDELIDMASTAAAITQMDVVISVDTSVAHLAAALGKPVWLLLPTDPDFRWLLHREDSPWYPTMKLFRQSSPGVWDDVVEKITQHLLEQRSPHEAYANT